MFKKKIHCIFWICMTSHRYVILYDIIYSLLFTKSSMSDIIDMLFQVSPKTYNVQLQVYKNVKHTSEKLKGKNARLYENAQTCGSRK